MMNLKEITIAFTTTIATSQIAAAIPFLQLDIIGGSYVAGMEESTIANSDPFTVVALIDSTSNKYSAAGTYYLSVAVIPGISPEPALPPDLGSFSLNGTSYNVTGDMLYGTPPITAADLGSHGIFDTYFLEFSFDLTSSYGVQAYDVEPASGPGGDPVQDAAGTLRGVDFDIDTTLLDPNYELHFDLYTYTGNKLDQKAPFSHDAASGEGMHPVPESGMTLAMLGMSLIALVGAHRKLREAA